MTSLEIGLSIALTIAVGLAIYFFVIIRGLGNLFRDVIQDEIDWQAFKSKDGEAELRAPEFQKGMVGLVQGLWPHDMKMPLHDRRLHRPQGSLFGKWYYLVYRRESDGPIASWRSSVKILYDEPIVSEEDLAESINYMNPAFVGEEKIADITFKDAEFTWSRIVGGESR